MFRVELWLPEAEFLLRNLTHTATLTEAMQACALHLGSPLVWSMNPLGVWSARSTVFEYRIVAVGVAGVSRSIDGAGGSGGQEDRSESA